MPETDTFIAVDWGTTSFRLWHMLPNGEIASRAVGPFGMSTLARDDFEKVLNNELAKLDLGSHLPVIISGMAGAAQGWVEVPYLSAPTCLTGLGNGAKRVPGISRPVSILPGVMQAQPTNVMRGEETQILGLLQRYPDYNGVVCLPGTHSKWARVSSGQIEQFTTCMTGEIFAILAEHSVLKHSMVNGGWEVAAFEQAVKQVLEAPASLAETLFSLRTDMLLADLSSAQACARLSGMLIGFELASTRRFWEAASVALIGDLALCSKYADALVAHSCTVEIHDSEAMASAGLYAAFKQMEHARHD